MQSTFLRSLSIQARVVGALLMREIITRFGRHNIGFMWLFVEPMMFTSGITILWNLSKMNHGSDVPITAFALTGYSSVLVWRNAVNRCNSAITPNLSLLFHRNVRVIDFYIARLMLEIAGAAISFITLAILFIAIGWMEMPVDIFTLMAGWFFLVWFAIGLGLIIGCISERSEMVDRFWHTITYLIFPFSGAAFFVEWLPKTLQDFVLWLPMVHGTEMIRHGYFGEKIPTHESVSYLVVINSILLLIALILVKDTAKKVEPE